MEKAIKMGPMDRTLIPAVILLLGIICVFELSSIDLIVQDYFYDFTQKSWMVNAKSFGPRLLFYTATKFFVMLVSLVLLLSALSTKFMLWVFRNRLRRVDVLVALATLAIAPSLVAWSKATTNVHCPYDLHRYHGAMPYAKVFEKYPPHQKPKVPGRGFPAGHASGGFALMSLAGMACTRRGRWIGFSIGISLGTIMGVYQMFKGAHFLSHTLVTAVFCWIVFLSMRRLFGLAHTGS